MAEILEAGTTNFPVHGGDVTVSLTGGATLTWLVQSVDFEQEAKRYAIHDLNGDTKARAWYDKDGEKSVTMEVIMTGTTGAGAITANTLPVIGTTKYTLASTKFPSMNGDYICDVAKPKITNAGPMSYTITMRKIMS